MHTRITYTPAAQKQEAPRHQSLNRIEVRVSPEEKKTLVRNAKLLGVSQSSLIRSFIGLPIETHRAVKSGATPFLLVDTVTLSKCVSQLRRAGYNIDYALHALNTLNAKPSLQEERKLELLTSAARESELAAKHYAETCNLFSSLFPSTERFLFVGRDRRS